MQRHKPSDIAETTLIQEILDGTYPPGSKLPGERELAASLGMTRPTLREALTRLDRDGWLTIQHGKATRVNDYWQEGGLNLLAGLLRSGRPLPPGFVMQLLEVRRVLAPAYAASAVRENSAGVAAFLADVDTDVWSAETFCEFDWSVHRHLCISSRNPVYTLILNGFKTLYLQLGVFYFQHEPARELGRTFYRDLAARAAAGDAQGAADVTTEIMNQTVKLWETLDK